MDDSNGPLWALIFFVLFIIINGILYGFGAAVQKINENEIEKKALEDHDKKSVWLLKVMNHPVSIVNTILTTATLLSILTGYIGISGITPYVYEIFINNPDRWVYRTAGIVRFFVGLFTPLTFVILKISNGVVRLFGVDPHRHEDQVTEEEIISMVDDAHEKGVIEENEAEMIQNIIEFSETEAQDIMTHRKNINGLDENTTLKDALEFMLNNSNSRYPVYREDLDNIVGILHLKDAMRQISSSQCGDLAINVIPGLIREASYIPETRNINELFKAMQAKKIHMAIVVDEYGQTAGLVTMEDILEEIVGNILDEYDEEEQFIHVQTDDSLIMDGFTPLEQVDEVLDSDFDETEEFDTLNGYLTSVLGHVPNMEEDKEIKTKGYLFTILGVENNTIQKVRVEKLPEEERGEETCQDIQNSQT